MVVMSSKVSRARTGTASGLVVQGVSFYPRGGSAHVVGYLTRALLDAGWTARIATGSVGHPGQPGHAESFYKGLPVYPADFNPALDAWRRGEDPMDQPVPLHASYEDKPGAPDRILASVSAPLAARQVDAWCRLLATVTSVPPTVLHLHHLTPLHDAATRVWPQAPVVTHLHGTELLMLEHIEQGALAPASAAALERGWSPAWPYADYWASRLRATAQRSHAILATSSDQIDRAVRLLRVPDDRLTLVPNGVDVEHFHRLDLTAGERLGLLRRWLVDEPQGWDESGRPGSVRYSLADLSEFVDPASGLMRPALLYVGRFTAVKRLSLLIRAYARLRARLGPVAPLVIWGGHPGEWEGEHPYTVVRKEEVDGVFFVGWRDHDDLRLGFGCADLLVAPSVGEAFGSVYLEAMAAGLPFVATRTGGPATFLNLDPRRPEGWLIPPDDEAALVDVLDEALTFPQSRLARAEAGHALVRDRFSWRAVAQRVAAVYDAVRD